MTKPVMQFYDGLEMSHWVFSINSKSMQMLLVTNNVNIN